MEKVNAYPKPHQKVYLQGHPMLASEGRPKYRERLTAIQPTAGGRGGNKIRSGKKPM
jgi:hypothetical protein